MATQPLVIPRPFKLRLEYNAASGKKGKTYLTEEHQPYIIYGTRDMSMSEKEDPDFDCMGYWQGMIIGIQGERCGELMYQFLVKVPENYPENPPVVRLVNKISLPCIDSRGFILVNKIPNYSWSPTHDIAHVLMAIRNAMKDKAYIGPSWQLRDQRFFNEDSKSPEKNFQ